MITLLSVDTSGRQLISNFSNQSLDLMANQVPGGMAQVSQPIFFLALVILGIALGLALGRRRIVSFILVLYLTTAVGALAPFEKILAQAELGEIYILIAILVLLTIFFVIPAHFSGNRFWFINWVWTAIFGLLSVGLLLTMIIQFSPSTWLGWMPALVVNVFSHNISRVVWTFLPLIFLWLAARRNEE